MGTQIADDVARRMPRFWLGPSGSWRWPFDATFAQWGLGALASAALTVPLWRVVPFGLLVLGSAWALGRALGPLVAPRRPVPVRWAVSLAVVALVGLLAPSWRLWAFPLPVWGALPVAVLLAVLLVRAFGRHVNFNRPITYWALLPFRTAAGPRPGTRLEIEVEHLLDEPMNEEGR